MMLEECDSYMALLDIPSAAFRQTCKACGRPDKFNFEVSDVDWNEIVPQQYRGLVLCLSCFDLFAAAGGHEYTLVAMQFVGDQGVYELRPSRLG
jgi:hypothetical protein